MDRKRKSSRTSTKMVTAAKFVNNTSYHIITAASAAVYRSPDAILALVKNTALGFGLTVSIFFTDVKICVNATLTAYLPYITLNTASCFMFTRSTAGFYNSAQCLYT